MILQRRRIPSSGRAPLLFAGFNWRRFGRIVAALPAATCLLGIPFAFAWLRSVELRTDENCRGVARTAIQSGNTGSAILACRRLLQRHPESHELQFELAALLSNAGEKDQSSALIARLTPLKGPGHIPARLWLASRLMLATPQTLDNVTTAERQLNAVLQADPNHAEAMGLLCRLYVDTGRLSEAESHLSKTTREDRFDLQVRLARVHRRIGDRQRAKQLIASTEEYFSQLLFRDPNNLRARLWLAEVYVLEDRHEEAITLLRDGVRRLSSSELFAAIGGAFLAWAQDLDASTSDSRKFRTKLLEQCVAAFEKAGPADSDVNRQMASAFLLLGQLGKAQPHLEVASTSNPGLLLELARLHGVQGHTHQAVRIAEDALNRFQAGLAIEPQSEVLRVMTADAEYLLRRYDSAVKTLEAGLTSDSGTVLRRAAARVLVGWFDEVVDKGDWTSRNGATDLLRRANRFDPWNIAVLQRLESSRRQWRAGPNPAESTLEELLAGDEVPIFVWASLGARATALNEWDRARTLLEKAYKTDSSLPDVANNLAWVLAHQGTPELPRALEIATAALNGRSIDAPLLLGTRGEIYARLGNWSAARQDLEKAYRHLKGRLGFHQLLADVYEHLNEAELAKTESDWVVRLSAASSP